MQLHEVVEFEADVGWGAVGAGGWGVGGGRIVAASEMLRPSVEHFQQAEVMPRGFKK